MRRLMLLIAIAMTATACTTVRVYDANGNMTGKCSVRGFPLIMNGHCEGNANGSGK